MADKNVLQQRFLRVIQENRLLAAGARVLAGVSGGADSVALLHLLKSLQRRMRLALYVVHVDHQLRDDSPADAAFVRRFAENLQLPVFIERCDVRALCKKNGWSLEEGARRARYACFQDAVLRCSADSVVLAHTADDQAETVLMRFLRGSGIQGLSAMPFARPLSQEGADSAVTLVRPLLSTWRAELVDYLAVYSLEFREDPSNRDARFLRNRIRHQLIPLLEREYNPSIKAGLVQLAEQSRCDHGYLSAAAGRHWKRLVRPSAKNRIVFAVEPFIRQDKALQRQVIRQALYRLRGDWTLFEFRHWREIERLFEQQPSGSEVSLPDGVRLVREGDRVVCTLQSRNGLPNRGSS